MMNPIWIALVMRLLGSQSPDPGRPLWYYYGLNGDDQVRSLGWSYQAGSVHGNMPSFLGAGIQFLEDATILFEEPYPESIAAPSGIYLDDIVVYVEGEKCRLFGEKVLPQYRKYSLDVKVETIPGGTTFGFSNYRRVQSNGFVLSIENQKLGKMYLSCTDPDITTRELIEDLNYQARVVKKWVL